MKPEEGQLVCPEPFFTDLTSFHLGAGQIVRFRASGQSMWPFVRDGDWVAIEPLEPAQARPGDILFYRTPGGGLRLHRLIRRRGRDGVFLPKGDAAHWLNEVWLEDLQILGRVVRLERGGRPVPIAGLLYRWLGLGYSLSRVAWHLLTSTLRWG
ncbi:MAG: S24/S26 family peptidase [Anaerolineae bacterium]